jgi:hypothetical protein
LVLNLLVRRLISKKIEIPALDPEKYKITVHIEQPIKLTQIPVTVPKQTVHIQVETDPQTSTVHVKIPYEHIDPLSTSPTYGQIITEYLETDVKYDVPGVKFDKDVVIEEQTVYFNYTYDLDFEQVIDLYNTVNELYGNVTEPIKDVNKTLEDLEKFMDEVNEMLESVQNMDAKVNGQINDVKNDIKNEISAILTDSRRRF